LASAGHSEPDPINQISRYQTLGKYPPHPPGFPPRPQHNVRHSLWLIVIFFLALPSLALAQEKQAWIDYFGTLQFSPRWAVELNPGTAYLAAEGGWRDYYAAGTAMFTPLNWLELQGGLEGHYTVDPVQENSVEIRPSLASVFTWATYGQYLNLFYPFFMAKYEERFISYQESGTSQTLSRLRFSVSARFPLNSPILDPGTWYPSSNWRPSTT
jgi:hypothetical protein